MSIEGIKFYLKHPERLFIKFGASGHLQWMSDDKYLKIRFKLQTGRKLDLIHPQSFNEKIQWIKINDRNPLYTQLVDKCEARKFISKEIGEEHTVKFLGEWNCFDDIDFNSLPDRFVLKCNHDSGSVVVCRDKKTLNYEAAKKQLEKSLKLNYYWNNREWAYKNIRHHRIFAEEYLEENNAQCNDKGLVDYKFFCFNGKVKFLYISKGLENHKTARISFFDLDGEMMPFKRKDYKNFDEKPPMPRHLSQMVEMSNRLAQKINAIFVRMDFYEINNNVYFSEFTFYPCGGMMPFDSEKWNIELGKELVLPGFDK